MYKILTYTKIEPFYKLALYIKKYHKLAVLILRHIAPAGNIATYVKSVTVLDSSRKSNTDFTTTAQLYKQRH